jgi:hypothetical protein
MEAMDLAGMAMAKAAVAQALASVAVVAKAGMATVQQLMEEMAAQVAK